MTPALLDTFDAFVYGIYAGLEPYLWIVVPLVLAAFAVAYFLERDAKASGKRVAGGFGAVGVAVVATLTGVAEGFAGAGGGVVDVLAPHLDFLAHLGLSWAGWSALQGGLMSHAPTFVAVVIVLIGVSVVWGE